MYSRNVGGYEYTFGVSGMLWHGVLVMFDRETDSLWTQLDGRSIEGEESGNTLEHVPSVFTTWAAWRDAHPETLVLMKDSAARAMTASNYAGYFDDPERTFLPHLGQGLGEGVGPKDVVFGVRDGELVLAVTEPRLAADGVVNGRLGDAPIAWLRNAATGAVTAVRRGEGELEPIEGVPPTEAVRDAATGARVEAGELEALRVDRAFWYAWARTVPGARVLTD